MEREKREEGLCHIMCGSLAGFVACLWFWLNQATIWTLLKGVVKMIVWKGSIHNLMGFRFFFTDFLRFMLMYLERLSAILHNLPCEYSRFSLLSLLGTFRQEERPRLSDRNSIRMTWINFDIINPVVMGFEMYLFDFMFLLVELEQNADAFSKQESIPGKLTVL